MISPPSITKPLPVVHCVAPAPQCMKGRVLSTTSAGRASGGHSRTPRAPAGRWYDLTPMHDLTQGSINRHLLALSSFMAVSMLFQTLYYLADLYFVGRLGKDAIAAVGLAGNLMIVVLAITQTLGVGTTTLVSHAVGQKDHDRAGLVFNQAFVLSLVVGFVVAVLGLV